MRNIESSNGRLEKTSNKRLEKTSNGKLEKNLAAIDKKIDKEKELLKQKSLRQDREQLNMLQKQVEKKHDGVEWIEKSQVVIADYILWSKRGARLRIQKQDEYVVVTMDIYNNGPGSAALKKIFPLSEADNIPEFIKKSFEKWVQMKTLFDIKIGDPYIPNEKLLYAIDKKTRNAVSVFKEKTKKPAQQSPQK